eukprot:SAG22_NODE_21836_length_253_cov_1.279221_1_plen_67_part_01
MRVYGDLTAGAGAGSTADVIQLGDDTHDTVTIGGRLKQSHILIDTDGDGSHYLNVSFPPATAAHTIE